MFPDRLWGPLCLLSNGYQGILHWGVKRRGREADHSPPSSAEDNAWSYTSTSPIRFMARCSAEEAQGKLYVLKLVPRHEDVWGSAGIAPRILYLDTGWRWVVSFTSRPLYTWGRAGGTHWQNKVRYKLFLCQTKHHATKMHWGVEVWLHNASFF
jgi:hypothetical protein